MVSLVFVLALAACAKQGQQVLDSLDPSTSQTQTEYPTETPISTETSTPSATPTVTETSTPTQTPTPDIQATRIAEEEEYDNRFVEIGIEFPEALTSRSDLFTLKISKGFADIAKVAEFRITNKDLMNQWGSGLLFPFAFKQAFTTEGTTMDVLEEYMIRNQISLSDYEMNSEAVLLLKYLLLEEGALIDVAMDPANGIIVPDEQRSYVNHLKYTGVEVNGSVRRVEIRILRYSELDDLSEWEDCANMNAVHGSSIPGGGALSEIRYTIRDDVLQMAIAFIEFIPDPYNIRWESLQGPTKTEPIVENRVQSIHLFLSLLSLNGPYTLALPKYESNSIEFNQAIPPRGGLYESDFYNTTNYAFQAIIKDP